MIFTQLGSKGDTGNVATYFSGTWGIGTKTLAVMFISCVKATGASPGALAHPGLTWAKGSSFPYGTQTNQGARLEMFYATTGNTGATGVATWGATTAQTGISWVLMGIREYNQANPFINIVFASYNQATLAATLTDTTGGWVMVGAGARANPTAYGVWASGTSTPFASMATPPNSLFVGYGSAYAVPSIGYNAVFQSANLSVSMGSTNLWDRRISVRLNSVFSVGRTVTAIVATFFRTMTTGRVGVGGSMATYHDDFVRGDSSSMGTDWGSIPGVPTMGIFQNHAAEANNTSGAANVWTAGSFSNDQFCRIKPSGVLSGYRYTYGGVRMGGSLSEGYYACTDGVDTFLTYCNTSGAWTDLQILSGTGAGVTGTMEIRAIGTALRLWFNGGTAGTSGVEHSSITSGRAGGRSSPDTYSYFDNWVAGDLGVSETPGRARAFWVGRVIESASQTVVRTVSLLLSKFPTVSRLRNLRRTIPVSMSRLPSLKRIGQYLKTTQSRVSRLISLSQAKGVISRSISFAVSRAVALKRSINYIRGITRTGPIAFAASRIRWIFRWAELEIDPKFTVRRIASYTRTLATRVSRAYTLFQSKMGITLRTLVTRITPTNTVSRVGQFARTLASRVARSVLLSKIGSTTRSVVTRLSVSLSSRRIGWYIRRASMSLGVLNIPQRVAQFSRRISTSLSVRAIVSKVGAAFRNVVTALVPTVTVRRIGSFIRRISTAITPIIRVAQSKLGITVRTVISQMRKNFALVKVAQLYRTVRSIRAASFSLARVTSRLVFLTIGLFTPKSFAIKRLGYWRRVVGTGLSVQLQIVRYANLLRMASTRVSRRIAVSRSAFKVRFVQTAISVGFNLRRVGRFARTIATTIRIRVIASWISSRENIWLAWKNALTVVTKYGTNFLFFKQTTQSQQKDRYKS